VFQSEYGHVAGARHTEAAMLHQGRSKRESQIENPYGFSRNLGVDEISGGYWGGDSPIVCSWGAFIAHAF